jgi:nucleotide-binding universal stress UspA family protein
MTVTRPVIVGFDGSQHAHDALALASVLAHAREVPLVAACVYVYRSLAPAGKDDEYGLYLRGEAQARLQQAAALTDQPLELVPVAGGSVAEGLHRLAEQRDADIVVLGSSHVGAIGRVMAGSVPERLLHGVSCAVAIAPRGFATDASRTLSTIGVGFDGTPESHAALALAADLARATGARVRAIHACDPHISSLTPRAVAAIERSEYEATLRRYELQQLQQAAEAVGASAEVEDGDAAATLTARSHELDLLVLGSRSYGPLRRVLLGSISTRVVRQAACPVLVVPRGASDVPRVAGPAGERAAAG